MASSDDTAWRCPWCGNTETWFDRTFAIGADGEERGMKDRCTQCGHATDDLPEPSALAHTLAHYVEHSTYEPLPGATHPFRGLPHAEVARLIQQDIDAANRTLLANLRNQVRALQSKESKRIEELKLLRAALARKKPNEDHPRTAE